MTERTLGLTAPAGNVGRHLVRDLVRAGVRPRVLSHRPGGLPPELLGHVDELVVDLTDPDAVHVALDGVDALGLIVPSVPADDPVAAYDAIGVGVTAALEAHEVGHVILQSSVGAELRHGAGEIDGLARVEERLDATGASVVHLRCGFFFSNLQLMLDDLRAGEVSTLLPTDHRMPWVAPADVARVAAGWLLRDDWAGRHVRGVHGPVDLSWDDVLADVAAVTGHSVVARRVSDEGVRSGLAAAGLTPARVEAVVGMSAGLRDGFVAEQTRGVTTTTATTLASWAYDELRPLLA
ncbi:NAD(P)H-binding protein [Nocardioides sp. CFH 31398]|uniref:NAD(P)H-binding protein n=1 Tax=Nocardioides sp. CFH 31398 TaxID=2919579 RepID=UPI001F063B49|nr:NAD(P)H-binding protein [Nocardioides sp. CFH 31398]MCH1866376.1 NAD(P)H-binding protein [Nocardioides sp. CFH 31398]